MVKPSRMGTVVLLRRRVPSSRYLRVSQMVKPSRMGTAVLLRRRVPSSRYLRESQMVKLSRMGTAVSLRKRVPSSRYLLRRLELHGQNAPKTASPRHCEKIVLLGGT